MFRIVEDDMPPLPESCSELLRDFLTQCFHKDPTKRPDAEILFEHEWLKQNWAPHKVRYCFLNLDAFGKSLNVQLLTCFRRIFVHRIASHSSVVLVLTCKSPRPFDT